MLTTNLQLVRGLVREEIDRIVADAAGDRRVLHAGRHASRLLQSYPNCGFRADDLVNQIGASAACAGVAVELTSDDRSFGAVGLELGR